MPQPQIDIRLLEQLNDAMSNRDQLAVARIERSGKGLLSQGAADAATGYTILGACAALRGEAEQAKGLHQKALQLLPYDLDVWSNYLVSLMVLWDTASARVLAMEIGEKFHGNYQAQEKVITTLMELGLMATVAEFKEKFTSSQASFPYWDDRIAKVLKDRGVSEDEFSQAVRVARSALQEKIVCGDYSCHVLIDEASGPGEIAYGFFLDTTPAEAASIERHMFERLDEQTLAAEEKGSVTFYVKLQPASAPKEMMHASDAT